MVSQVYYVEHYGFLGSEEGLREAVFLMISLWTPFVLCGKGNKDKYV